MKKTFKLTNDKIKPERLIESIKHEIRKYLKRERNKKLTDNADYLDFDCKFGADQSQSEAIHLAEIDKCIGQAVSDGLESFYLEIIAKPGYRNKQED